MSEPQKIIDFISQDIKKELKLYNKNVMITAGPT